MLEDRSGHSGLRPLKTWYQAQLRATIRQITDRQITEGRTYTGRRCALLESRMIAQPGGDDRSPFVQAMLEEEAV